MLKYLFKYSTYFLFNIKNTFIYINFKGAHFYLWNVNLVSVISILLLKYCQEFRIILFPYYFYFNCFDI